MCPVCCTRDWQTLCKEPDSNCFSPPTHTAPVATAQLCHCGMKAYSMQTHASVLMNATHGPMFGDPSAGEMKCLPALKRLTVCGGRHGVTKSLRHPQGWEGSDPQEST